MFGISKRVLTVFACAAFCLNLLAVEIPDSTLAGPAKNKGKIKFACDVKADVTFDNREYATSLDYSRTLFGIRPTLGLGISAKTGKVNHRLLGGASVLYEFGGGWTVQPLVWYDMKMPLKHSTFNVVAGAFPRHLSHSLEGEQYYSIAQRFYDNIIEGLQFAWSAPTWRIELGLDWIGMISPKQPQVRENFSIYSGGYKKFHPCFRIGYDARIHHYACNCADADNVIDDIIFNPWIEADVAYWCKMQILKLRVGYYQGLSRDRGISSSFAIPGRGEITVEARKWNVGIANVFMFGGDMMPLYNAVGPDSGKYGSNLYMADPIMMRNEKGASFGTYDRVTLYYQPRLAKWVDLNLRVMLLFNGGYAGCQQMISVIFHMDR